MIYCTSDWHLNPGVVFPENLISLKKLYLVGDMFNIIPLGMGQWRTYEGRRTVDSIVNHIPADSTFIAGNHEGRLSWLKELLSAYPHIRVMRSDVSQNYKFIHGHQYTDWKVWAIGADDITEWLTTNALTRKLWYKFCVSQGWLPSKYANPGREYEPIVGAYWAMILRQAHKEHLSFVVGHSHQRCDIETPWIKIIDLGCREVVEIPG